MSEKLIVVVDRQIAELVPRFLSHRAGDVDKIRAALASGDFAAIRVMAHGMKGAGGGYGFPEISRIGAAMELAADRRDADAISELTTNLEAYLARVEIRYGNE